MAPTHRSGNQPAIAQKAAPERLQLTNQKWAVGCSEASWTRGHLELDDYISRVSVVNCLTRAERRLHPEGAPDSNLFRSLVRHGRAFAAMRGRAR